MGDISVAIAAEVVKYMLGGLKEVIKEQAHLISDSKKQLDELESNMLLLKDFQADYTKLSEKNILIKDLLRNIRDRVYEAEDAVDNFISSVQGKNLIQRTFNPVKFRDMAERIQSIGKKVNELCTKVKEHIQNNTTTQDGGLEEYDHQGPSLIHDNKMVGFEVEESKLIGRLTTESEQLEVICIIGTPGLGKTRLAANIFHHPTIQDDDKFSKRIWVSVSDAKTSKVFLTILRKLGKLTEGMHHKSLEELGNLVAVHLEGEKFLVVLDDVRAAGDWKKLKAGFPKRHKMSKVLITSCHDEVARVITNPAGRPHMTLRSLTQDEGWRLLQLRVFGSQKCPQELERSGKLIVAQCDRLPMVIVEIADILAKKVSESDNVIARRDAWAQVSNSLHTFLNDDPSTMPGRVKLLSRYDQLPYHLRNCFLYLGLFPERYKIPVSSLIRMWIAEGFVQHKDGLSLEETAGNYLNELISRNLVGVLKKKSNGTPKTCCTHYLLRNFCITEAGKERENFLQELKSSSDGDFHPPISEIEKYRRLCIYSDVLSFILSKPSGERIRSFACFSGVPITLEKENVSTIPAAFKLLKVLDVKPIKFTKIPNRLYRLVHLRYAALSLASPILPADFSKLRNIQTLIVYTTSKTIKIKADILKMIQLRHFKTNVSATLPKTNKSSNGGKKLQTLGSISPKSCTEEFFDRICNLNKLSVCGKLALLLDGKDKSFNFWKLPNLTKLKLVNDVHTEGKHLILPQRSRFPACNLRRLTLSATSLKWSNMNILGSLDQLEVLKLRDNAFVGTSWETKGGGFLSLQILRIESKDLVVWQASHKHFPELRCLELRNCEKLGEVPIDLAHIKSFVRLQLWNSTSADESARRIQEKKLEVEEAQTTKTSLFKLSFSLDG